MISLTYIHEGQVGPSALKSQVQAHKARLQRFAEAASRHQRKNQPSVVLERYRNIESEPAKQRRDYENVTKPSPYMPTARRVLIAVSNEFEMPVDRILAKSNEAKYVLPRFVAIGLMIDLTRMSLPAIGRWLGGRDHTTIISGRNRLSKLLESEAFRNRYEQIKAGLA